MEEEPLKKWDLALKIVALIILAMAAVFIYF